MLEGGQTKEEQKRTEVFWNETLAPDDIDRLKEPKAFSNIKRYDTEGVHENVTDLSLTDNYIIKGNNLLVLYSLLPVYRGKVKLIYIDPPYNNGIQTFGYNDAFNHTLTFQKALKS
jgi:adenine-specific DNA-methyltransferase